jgi:hypothetical protein
MDTAAPDKDSCMSPETEVLGALTEVVVSPETLTSALDIEMELAVIETELPPTVMVMPLVSMTIEFSPT